MPQGRVIYFAALAVCSFSSVQWASAATLTPEVSVQSTCEVPGTVVELGLKVEASSGTIAAGQFSLQYNTAALQFISLEPGSACDTTSPFSTRIFQSVDQSAGRVFAAMGVDFGVDPHPLNGPVTVACLRLLPTVLSNTDVCLMGEAQPQSTKFLDGDGAEHFIAGFTEPAPGQPPVEIICTSVQVDENCACTPGGNECVALNTACRMGVCDEAGGVCMIAPLNELGFCDDQNACTTRDICERGECVGHDCSSPSICVVHQQCGRPGEQMQVAVRLGEGDVLIAGGQFSLQYDSAGLELVSFAPGDACDPSSPFTAAMAGGADESAGQVFYSVGVGVGQAPTMGPAILACLTFNVIDRSRSEVCTFLDVNPFNTYLVDQHGQIVQAFNGQDCPTDRPFPYTSCVEYEFCPIPTASAWSMLIMGLAILGLMKVASLRRLRA